MKTEEPRLAVSGSKNIVYSVEKAFRVLQAFTSETPELLLAEVARRAEVDNATAFRMLNTLVMLGFVEKVPDAKAFRLTLKCLDLGFNAIARMDLRTIARPLLQRLVGSGAAAASMGVLDRGEVIYVERLQVGMTRLAVDIRVGTRIPAFSSAIGRAILSMLDEDRQRFELEQRPREKITPNTVTDLGALMKILRQTRERGISMVDQESVLGLVAVAAPVMGADGLPIAAVSLASASSAVRGDDFLDKFKDQLISTAQILSKAMQASGGILGGS